MPIDAIENTGRKQLKPLAVLLGEKGAERNNFRLILGHLALREGERLSLALTIASSVLQLHGTQWLGDLWDRSCIMFDMVKMKGEYQGPTVFIRKVFPEPKKQPEQSLFGHVIPNPLIYNLGIILIEICLGQTLQSFRMQEDPLDHDGKPNILTDLSSAMRLIEPVYSVAGTGYGDVVRRCIRSDFDSRRMDLTDDSFRQNVYERIVEPLEEDVKNFYRLDQR